MKEYGGIGLALLAAVVSAGVSWGIYADRSDNANTQLAAMSARMTTLALQIHGNALALATMTERLAAVDARLKALENGR